MNRSSSASPVFPLPLVFSLLLLGTLVLASCKSDPLASELLAGSQSKSWRIESITTDGIDESLNECEVTFILVFNADGSWSASETGNDCSPELRSGTWTMNSVGAEMEVTESGIAEEWRVLDLTESRLEILRMEGALEQVQRYNAL